MVSKIYEKEVKSINTEKKSFDDKNNFLNKQAKDYFSTKNKNFTFQEKNEVINYDTIAVDNKKKTFKKDYYILDKNPNTYKLNIYKVQDNLKPYSPTKNTKLVYSGGVTKESNYKDYKAVGK